MKLQLHAFCGTFEENVKKFKKCGFCLQDLEKFSSSKQVKRILGYYTQTVLWNVQSKFA